MKKVNKAIILCGGLATRFLPISKSVPKEMLPLLDKPILQIVVEDLAKAGIKDVLILVGRGKECILNHFDRNIELENRLVQTGKSDLLAEVEKTYNLANIVYQRQVEPKGTGYAIEQCKWFVENDEPFVLLFGDEVMLCDGMNIVEQLCETFEKENESVIASQVVPIEEIYRYGSIEKGGQIENGFKVKHIVEKPKPEEAPSNLAYIGAAILTKDIFPALKKLKTVEGKEKVLTDAFRYLAEDGNLCTRIIEGERHDMGNKFGFVKANICACLRDENYCKDMKQLILDLAEEIKNK